MCIGFLCIRGFLLSGMFRLINAEAHAAYNSRMASVIIIHPRYYTTATTTTTTYYYYCGPDDNPMANGCNENYGNSTRMRFGRFLVEEPRHSETFSAKKRATYSYLDCILRGTRHLNCCMY